MAQPLTGKRVAITRAREQAEELAAKLRALGALPLNWPLIAFGPPADDRPLREAIARCSQYDWIVFTSANGVRAFGERLESRVLPMPRIAAVGRQTAEALRRFDLHASAVPDEFLGDRIAVVLGDVHGQRILLVRPENAPAELPASLRARGALVTEVSAYRTVPAAAARPLRLNEVDAITLASGSAATQLAARLEGQTVPEHVCIACIGPSTADVAQAAGLPVTLVAPVHTLDGLVAALARYFTQEAAP
jgi:uroporphyrinogen-III synthase